MGGVRAVRAYCALTGHPQPEVFHTNEGHAGFLGLERIREYAAQGLSFPEAIELCRAGTVFTTHTPVPAGIDRFARDLVEREFGGTAADPALPSADVLALGAETYPGGDPAVFNMAVMGMRLAQRVNGVSELHGHVSQEMFAGLWPGFDAAEVPIGSITNGVHVATWVAAEILGRGEGDAGQHGPGPEDGPAWDRIAQTGPARLWEIRGMLRRRLVAEARERLRASWRQRGVSGAELGWTHHALDENVLTIGFARRVPSYKRLTLMLHDPERLTSLLLDPQRPVQLVIAGKAHPADDSGKQLIQQMVRFADDPRVRHRIVFLPDYDMELAAAMVQGCDVWLNNPLRPLEACGTSGAMSWSPPPCTTCWSRWWPRCSTTQVPTGCRSGGWRWSRTPSPGSGRGRRPPGWSASTWRPCTCPPRSRPVRWPATTARARSRQRANWPDGSGG
jgi:starch phosphorylase